MTENLKKAWFIIYISFSHEKDNPKLLNNEGIKDTVALINTTDLSPVIESAEVMTIKEVVNPATTKESVEVAVTVAQLPSTAPIEVRTGLCAYFLRS